MPIRSQHDPTYPDLKLKLDWCITFPYTSSPLRCQHNATVTQQSIPIKNFIVPYLARPNQTAPQPCTPGQANGYVPLRTLDQVFTSWSISLMNVVSSSFIAPASRY